MYKLLKRKIKQFKSWMDYNPPGSMSSKGWRLFNEEFKEQARVRYWFDKDFRRMFVFPVYWKYKDIRNWIRFRTYDKYHIIETGLKPDYYDIDTRILHVNFNMLREFVEVEQAWQSYCWSDEYKDTTWCGRHMPFYRAFFPFCRPDLGIKHFKWAATLDDPTLPPHERSDNQAKSAREVLALYDWWINQRPNRKEIIASDYSDQGLGGILSCFDDDFDRNAEDYKKHVEEMTAQTNQGEKWEQEDTDYLVRLMKIRHGLWT